MTIEELNLSALKKSHRSIYDLVAGSTSSSLINVIDSKKGLPVPSINDNGKIVFIHSKFDPVKEAERFIGEVDATKLDLFVVLGFGFAYHIEQLLAKMSKDSICLIIEKSHDMLKSAMECRDLSKMFGDSRVLILINPDEDAIAEALRGKSSKRSSFITHRGSFQADPDYYSNRLEIARSYLSTKEVNIATLAKFEKIWSANLARNIVKFTTTPGANLFYDKFSGIPAIVAAAGPSLNTSLDFIKENKGNAVIIAVDTSYKILIKNGIEPHFCIAVDPQVINARYFEGIGKTGTIMVADPTVHPTVFRFFNGPAATTGVAFDMMKWIERVSWEKGDLAHGGSVSTNAYDFAKRLGASPIILAGQDLAFTGGYAHAKGSYLDEQIHLKTTRMKNAEMFNRSQLTALPKIFVNGIAEEKVHTNQKMMIFLSWFENRRDDNLINATEAGALMSGVKHVRMKDIKIEVKSKDISGIISKIYNLGLKECKSSNDDIRKKITGRIDLMQKEIESMQPVLSRAMGFSDNLLSLMKDKKRDQSKLDYILSKLSETDRIIESKKNTKEMISLTIQRVVHTITEGYEIDADDKKMSDDELVAKRSRYMYEGLLRGAKFNGKVLGKMRQLLSE